MKIKLLILVSLLVIVFLGRSFNIDIRHSVDTSNMKETSENYPIYDVRTVKEAYNGKMRTVEYPEIVGLYEDYTPVNTVIKSEIDAWIKETIGDDAELYLTYSVVFSDDVYISILFEGSVVSHIAAHPTNVVRSLCISLTDNIVIDLIESIDINSEFVQQVKNGLAFSQDERFDDDQWRVIVNYLEQLSYEEWVERISEGEVALTEDGVLICVFVPHAIGDYLKIAVAAG